MGLLMETVHGFRRKEELHVLVINGERGAQPSLRGVQERDRRLVVNQVLWTRAAVQTVKKAEVNSNKKAALVVNAKKLDKAAEPAALDRVLTKVKQLIQKATPIS
ncbi:hypothetical protein SO802_004378 [Lithocarpus litseifolius]|uniref:Multiprotein bridging factor 1 N-terminal domain-containing protein n=1 Tax=Lithocarpus litseifolius TaxID=425828 RepID=A0AAW2E4Q7_9ROSI